MEKVTIRVPATTANLAAGFDVLGCALGLYNTLTFTLSDKLRFSGCASQYQNRKNLAYQAYALVWQAHRRGEEAPPVHIHIDADIPVSRGLGSSAALIAAGATAANIMAGKPFTKQQLLTMTTGLEGHPDNLAPALLGGLTASMMEGEQAFSVRYRVHESIRFCALVPDFELSTERARAVLPAQVPFRDAVYNLSRAAVFARAMETGDVRTLAAALSDRLHQPYRKPLLREYDAVRERALSCGAFGFCVSGAGPTLLALYTGDAFLPRIQHALTPLQNHWQALPLAVGDGAKEVRRGDEVLPGRQSF